MTGRKFRDNLDDYERADVMHLKALLVGSSGPTTLRSIQYVAVRKFAREAGVKVERQCHFADILTDLQDRRLIHF